VLVALIVIGVIVAVVVVLVAILVGMYNGLVRARLRVREAWSGIDVQLKRRASLIPNLVETVKGYAQHEREVFENVTRARAMLQQAGSPAQAAEANNMLTQTLRSLFAVAEAYPDLKANQNFLELQSQLEGTENRIAVARNRYIAAVQAYNVLIREFPVNLTAKMFGYSPKPNFSVENEAAISKAPTVDFGAPAAAPPALAPPASVAPAAPAN
jgi:LemA protein